MGEINMSDNQRIQQFRQMAEADPDNELGHFSLGKAYLEAGQADEAVVSLTRTLQIKPELSKAYQLLGEAHEKAGQREQAVEVVTRGVTIADANGDRMPRDAMVVMLNEWGATVPQFQTTATVEAEVAGRDGSDFRCSRCGKSGGKLEKAPFKGPIGERIFSGICTTCWREWIPMGTKVVNELGLVLSTPAGQESYDQYMLEFLQLEE